LSSLGAILANYTGRWLNRRTVWFSINDLHTCKPPLGVEVEYCLNLYLFEVWRGSAFVEPEVPGPARRWVVSPICRTL
jgi:hypothetical protein